MKEIIIIVFTLLAYYYFKKYIMSQQNKLPEPSLEKASFEFSQESHCCSDSSIEGESLEIEYISDMGLDRAGGGFFVLKTEQWAMDGIDDLKKLFTRIEKIIETTPNSQKY